MKTKAAMLQAQRQQKCTPHEEQPDACFAAASQPGHALRPAEGNTMRQENDQAGYATNAVGGREVGWGGAVECMLLQCFEWRAMRRIRL